MTNGDPKFLRRQDCQSNRSVEFSAPQGGEHKTVVLWGKTLLFYQIFRVLCVWVISMLLLVEVRQKACVCSKFYREVNMALMIEAYIYMSEGLCGEFLRFPLLG